MLFYFCFKAARQIFVCMILPCSKKPQNAKDIMSVIFLVLDSILFIPLTIYGSTVVFSSESMACKDEHEAILNWWIVCLCSLVYGWFYCLLLCLGIILLPVLLCIFCYY